MTSDDPSCLVLACQGYRDCNRTLFGKYDDLFTGNPPRLRTFASATEQLQRRQHHPKLPADETQGFYGRSVLFDLEYFDPILHCTLDMMHITSGVMGRHFIKLVLGTATGVRSAAAEAKKAAKRTPAQVEADEEAQAQEERKAPEPDGDAARIASLKRKIYDRERKAAMPKHRAKLDQINREIRDLAQQLDVAEDKQRKKDATRQKQRDIDSRFEPAPVRLIMTRVDDLCGLMRIHAHL
jgi:hypothetical protein